MPMPLAIRLCLPFHFNNEAAAAPLTGAMVRDRCARGTDANMTDDDDDDWSLVVVQESSSL